MKQKCECGASIKKGFKFCPSCGNPVEEPVRTYSLHELLTVYTDKQLSDAVKKLATEDEANIRASLFSEKIASPVVHVVRATYKDPRMEEENKKYHSNRRPWRTAGPTDIAWLVRYAKDYTNISVGVEARQATPSTMAAYFGVTVFPTKGEALSAAKKIARENGWQIEEC